jgi:pimeloyl-ACP methyl ester carboxylesterase
MSSMSNQFAALAQPVQTETDDGLRLKGTLYMPSGGANTCVVFTHGLGVGPNSVPYLSDLVERMNRNNVAVLAGWNRGTDVVASIQTGPKSRRLYGSAHERLSEAHFDVGAWSRFAQTRGFRDLVAVGHSMGAVKLIDYVGKGKGSEFSAVALVAPVDPVHFFQRRDPDGEMFSQAQDRYLNGRENELLPTTKPFVMSAGTYVEYQYTDVCPLRNREVSALKSFKGHLMVMIGDNDNEVSRSPSEDATRLLDSAPNARSKFAVIAPGNHGFFGYERQLAANLGDWVGKLDAQGMRPATTREVLHRRSSARSIEALTL